MLASDLVEYDASDADVRIVGGVAVLVMTTRKGRVVVSMTPEIVERLSLRIQLDLASGGRPTPAATEPEIEMLRLQMSDVA
jgi:hypothetical protein